MRIAITDLKDYNEAILRFEWLDLKECSSKDDISEYIKNFLGKRSRMESKPTEEKVKLLRDASKADSGRQRPKAGR